MTIKELLTSITKKLGGWENVVIIGMSIVIVILVIVYFRLDFLTKTFDNMCTYQYPSDYVCSCSNKYQNISNLLANLSIKP